MNVNVGRLISTTVTVTTHHITTVPPVTAVTVHEFLLFGRRVAKRYLRMPYTDRRVVLNLYVLRSLISAISI